MSATGIIELSAFAGCRGDRRGLAVRRRAVRGIPLARERRSRRRRERPELLHVGGRRGARGRAARGRGASGARRRAASGQGPVLHRGRAQPVRLADPRGLSAAVHGERRTSAAARRGEPAREDQPGRVRDGLLKRELGVRRRAQPVGPRARPGRLLRRKRRRRRRRARAVGARHRHRRLDPPARGAVRDRRPETDLRRRLALRHDRVRLLARPGRPADA